MGFSQHRVGWGCRTMSDDALDSTTQRCRLLGKHRRLFGCRGYPLLHILRRPSPVHCAMLQMTMRRRGLPQQDMAIVANQQSIECIPFRIPQVPADSFCELWKRPSCFRAVHTKRNARKNNGTVTFQFGAAKALGRAFRKLRFHFWFGTP